MPKGKKAAAKRPKSKKTESRASARGKSTQSGASARAKPAAPAPASKPYTHPTHDVATRPEIGTQAQFRKKKPPKTYQYDSSLSPALDWDGQNAARERGERLIKRILDATSLE